MKIILMRHGQSTGDLDGRYGGDYDDELTAQGAKQATMRIPFLSSLNIERLYSSPLTRAKMTASIIGAALHLPTQVIAEVKECNRYGVITGMTKEQALRSHPDEVMKVDDRTCTIKGGESYETFTIRVRRAMQELQRISCACQCIVTHGGIFRVLFREILQLGEISINDCGIAIISSNNNQLALEYLDGITLKK